MNELAVHINICVGRWRHLLPRGRHCSRSRRISLLRLFNTKDTRQFPRISALAATVKVTRRLRALSNHFREVSYSSLRALRIFTAAF